MTASDFSIIVKNIAIFQQSLLTISLDNVSFVFDLTDFFME